MIRAVLLLALLAGCAQSPLVLDESCVIRPCIGCYVPPCWAEFAPPARDREVAEVVQVAGEAPESSWRLP